LARQGWEPCTPIQLLYKAWAQQDLGGVDLEEWVICNSERVENERERSEVKLRKAAELRKKEWDRRAKERELNVGDEVLMQKPGMNFKLQESWEGPYKVTRRKGPLSYSVDTGERTIPSVHVQLLKKFERNSEVARIERATKVLEPDEEDDDITDRYTETVVEGDTLTESQKEDIRSICEEFSSTLTKEPGCTDLVEFGIDTGDHAPIAQRPYNTPMHFRQSIDQEIDWLLEKGYISKSTSAWASPIVCVRKPDGSARL